MKSVPTWNHDMTLRKYIMHKKACFRSASTNFMVLFVHSGKYELLFYGKEYLFLCLPQKTGFEQCE